MVDQPSVLFDAGSPEAMAATLRALLRRAEAGELAAMAVAFVTVDQTIRYRSENQPGHGAALIGAVSVLSDAMTRTFLKD